VKLVNRFAGMLRQVAHVEFISCSSFAEYVNQFGDDVVFLIHLHRKIRGGKKLNAKERLRQQGGLGP
jgi:hypothetical protein